MFIFIIGDPNISTEFWILLQCTFYSIDMVSNLNCKTTILDKKYQEKELCLRS